MLTLDHIAPGPNTGGWQDRHRRAVRSAWLGSNKPGDALLKGIAAWLDYAIAHAKRYEARIGEDSFLGPAWEQWGRALRTMLNGETGDLDCGTLDSVIIDNLVEQGFGE